jgi:CheY-like chemotaxis protein
MSGPTILVVDDNPDHLELTLLALSECCEGASIATATDGTRALDFLFRRRTHAQRSPLERLPRVVLLDMKLVGMNGLEVLQAIRAHEPTAMLPVVMHSSSSESSDISSCYAAGANSYLRKATDFDELRRRMRQVHEYWVLTNEKPPEPP